MHILRACSSMQQGIPTLVMPYIVRGSMMVSLGVITLGLLSPNTAMVLGLYTWGMHIMLHK